MCGRSRCTLRPDDIPRACHLNGRPARHVDMNRYRPTYNASPGFSLPVVRRDDVQGGDGEGKGPQQEQGAVVQCMKWGLIPSFTKKTEKPDHFKMFNARSESIREKASFRRLLPNNRCLVAVEGFYEWKKDGSKKQPYYIYFRDGRPLVFAALFDSWKNLEGEVFYTFTVVTTSASSPLEWLHDRMPVILSNKEATDMWLNGPSSNFDTILKPYGESDLVWHPVTTAMGKPSFDGPECISEIQLKKDETKTISQFFSKKGATSPSEPKSESRGTKEEPKSLKEGFETEDIINHQPVTKSVEDDIKPNISDLSRQGAIEVSAKREYEELSADSKHSDDESDKLHRSPVKKKGRGASDETMVKLEEHTKKASPAKPHKPDASSVRKKASSADDKQPTLFSYFGKGKG